MTLEMMKTSLLVCGMEDLHLFLFVHTMEH